MFFTAIDYRLGQDTFNFQSGVRLPVAVPYKNILTNRPLSKGR